MTTLRLALAQLDARLGDVAANERRVRETLADARAAGADLVVFPELYLSGYALRGVDADTARTPEQVAELVQSPAALVGFHELGHNTAAYVAAGEVRHVHRKLKIVDGEPFGEDELFTPGSELRVFATPWAPMAVLICNDAWNRELPLRAVHDGAEVLLMPSCSSIEIPEAEGIWRELTRAYARVLGCHVVFVNRVGTEPGFTYWGGSHVVDPEGSIVAEAPRLREALLVADVDLDTAVDRRPREREIGSETYERLLAELPSLTWSR
jgi:predicted amidohydrolase